MTPHGIPVRSARLPRLAAALMSIVLLCACSSGDGAGEQSPSPTPDVYYSTGSGALSLSLNGADCRVESDGVSISCEYEDGKTQLIHQIELDEAMFFFPAEVENLDGPGLVVSDKTGNGFWLIYFYRYDPEQGDWCQVPFSSDGSSPEPAFTGHAALNDGALELSFRDREDGPDGGWITTTFRARYSPEQDALILEQL